MTTPQDPFASPPDDRGSTPETTPPAPAWGTPPPGSTAQPPATGFGAPSGQSGADAPYGQPPQGNSNGLGIGALVVGLLALFTSWLVIGGVLGIVAIVLGVLALGKVKRGEASNKGMGIAGIVLGALSILVAGVILAVGAAFFDDVKGLSECVADAGGDAAAEAECERRFEDDVTG